jgi:hypothetical protein
VSGRDWYRWGLRLFVASSASGLLLFACLGGGLYWLILDGARIQEENHARLLANMPAECEAVTAGIAEIDAKLTAGDQQGAMMLALAVSERFDPYFDLRPTPPEVQAVTEPLVIRLGYFQALSGLAAAREELLMSTATQTDSQLQEALDALQRVTGDFAARPEVRQLRKDIERERKLIAPRLEQERKMEQWRARCGEAPAIVLGSGSFEIEYALRQTAHDPDSISTSMCMPALITERCWKVTCLVRGRNAFGALVAAEKTFYLGPSGRVVEE